MALRGVSCWIALGCLSACAHVAPPGRLPVAEYEPRLPARPSAARTRVVAFAADATLVNGAGEVHLRYTAQGPAYLQGQVSDRLSAEGLSGVTVVAQGERLLDTAAELTDEEGKFVLALPAGGYAVTFYYGDTVVRAQGVHVQSGGATWLDTALDLTTPRPADIVGCSFALP